MPSKEETTRQKVIKILLRFGLTPDDQTWEYLLNEGISYRDYYDLPWYMVETHLVDQLSLCDKAFGL
jgi:hypothetical protein